MPPQTTFKRLTASEMATRRGKGLCYNCDDRYGPNHKFRAKFFLLVAPDKPFPDEPIPPNPTIPVLSELQSEDPSALHSAQLSLHVMAGHSVSSILRVIGSV